MKAKIKFNGKEIEIPDIIRADGIKKFTGLMFKGASAHAYLFSFPNPGKYAIHSLFCKDFLAIWLNQGKIVEYKLIDRIKLKIVPEAEFTELIEIPLTDKYRELVSLFIQENSEKTIE